MRKNLFLTGMITLIIVSCIQPKQVIRSTTHLNGSGFKNALYVNTKSKHLIPFLEKDWVKRNFGKAKFKTIQKIYAGRTYDVVDLNIPNGQTKTVYFDVSGAYAQ